MNAIVKSLGGYVILVTVVVMVGIVAIHRHVSNPEPKKIETPHTKAPVKPQPKKTDAKPAPKPHHKHLQRFCDPATGWCWTEWR